jgi:hypothetical protein
MEEFRPFPLPSLRLQGSSSLGPPEFDLPRKPSTMRRSTDPSPTSPSSPSWSSQQSLPFRPRTTSPLSGSHTRSRSAASLPPPMARTRSLPGVNGAGHILYSPQMRPRSPSGSPSRARTPRKPVDEAFPPTSPTRVSVHDHERRLSERNSAPNLGLGLTPANPPQRLRRPSSPLRQISHYGSTPLSSVAAPTTPSSAASSPSYRSYDPLTNTFSGYPSSSVPSTPTSTRSRSPSISSLETIPDSPDAEEAALEAERIAQLKAAADATESKGKSLDLPGRGRTLGGFGSRDKRKRWSVCGAERRGDLDLETIWED